MDLGLALGCREGTTRFPWVTLTALRWLCQNYAITFRIYSSIHLFYKYILTLWEVSKICREGTKKKRTPKPTHQQESHVIIITWDASHCNWVWDAKLTSLDTLEKKLKSKFPHASTSLSFLELKSLNVPYLPCSIYAITACYPISQCWKSQETWAALSSFRARGAP